MSETLAEPEIDSETDTQTGTRRALTLALQGEVFAIDGRTYVLVNQWGTRTLEAAKLLAEKFPKLQISFEASE